MSFGNTTENDVLNYVFDSAAPSWASNANFFLRLHTADPGEAGTATTSEATYTSYDGVAVSRTTGFTITGNSVTNAGLVQFPLSTGGSNTITHVSICTTQNGAGQIIARAALGSSRSITDGDQPQFNAGTLTFTLD